MAPSDGGAGDKDHDRMQGTWVLTKLVDAAAAGENEKKLVGMTTKGIYSFDGETLKLCLGATGGDRPAKFSTEGEGYRVLYLKRSK